MWNLLPGSKDTVFIVKFMQNQYLNRKHMVPDGSIFFTIKEWKDYFQFLSQIGAH